MIATSDIDAPASAWTDAVLAAALFAIDPAFTGGVSLRGAPGPVRQQWLDFVRAALPPERLVPSIETCPKGGPRNWNPPW